MHDFAIDLEVDGPVTVVRLTGDVDLSNADDVKTLGRIAVTAPHVSLVEFDMSGVTFINSTGISALMAVRNTAEGMGVGVRIRAASQPARRVLGLLGLAEMFGVVADP